ncbi:Hachiman antiphage defense system protein HamA [Enterococcus sp. DIV0802b]|uniref:Hachiman antiphage defense system protein HamA n=1 Tax=Enterococcus sp. DIV0802b TaxID=2774704 RepID=UPI003D2FD51A
MEHIDWLIRENDIEIRDGKIVQCYRIDYDLSNEKVMKSWAKHIRRQYESDESLDESLNETLMEAEEYLRENVIPQKSMVKGSTMRSADFGEIIFSDLLEFVYGYTIPRCKLYDRATPTQSEQGTDIIGYKFNNTNGISSVKDELCAVESKMSATSSNLKTINSAIKHSIKDELRVAVTLNYYRKKLKRMGKTIESNQIARFQKKSEKDFVLRLMAGAAISRKDLNPEIEIIFEDEGEIRLEKVDSIFLIHCNQLMDLVHEIYERCIE